MSDKLIVAAFPDSNDAYDAVGELKRIKDQGNADFKLKAGVMVKKDMLGNVTLLEERDRIPLGLPVGTAAGALLGLIGGPAGAAIGASVGALTGASGDAIGAVLDDDFVSSVASGMLPGTSSVIVEANEGGTRLVDNIVAQHHGTVFRQEI